MTEETPAPSNNTMSYILGGVLVVAVVAGGYFLRPKSNAPAGGQQTTGTVETPSPTLGPISGLACDTQYFNPVIAFPKYYLSVEGSDIEGASEVTCTTKVTQENKVVATEEVSVPLTENEARGGLTFRCSTPSLDLKPTIPTKVDVSLKDDKGDKASCSRVFALPAP